MKYQLEFIHGFNFVRCLPDVITIALDPINETMSEHAHVPMSVDSEQFANLEMIEIEGVFEFPVNTFNSPTERKASYYLFCVETSSVGEEYVCVLDFPIVPLSDCYDDPFFTTQTSYLASERVNPESLAFTRGVEHRYRTESVLRDEFIELICANPCSAEGYLSVNISLADPGATDVFNVVDEFFSGVPGVEYVIRKGNPLVYSVIYEFNGNGNFASKEAGAFTSAGFLRPVRNVIYREMLGLGTESGSLSPPV